jgi:hypothetical protein
MKAFKEKLEDALDFLMETEQKRIATFAACAFVIGLFIGYMR